MAFSADKALQNRLIVLGAPEQRSKGSQDISLVLESLKELISAAGLTPDDLDLESFAADQRPPQEWLGAACQVPFLADYRVVVVRNIGRVTPKKFWDENITAKHPFVLEAAKLPDTARVILVADEEPLGDLGKQQRFETAVSSWRRIAEKSDGVAYSFEADPSKIIGRLVAAAKERGKSLARPAASRLAEMVGGKANLALVEVEKLALYVGDRPEIREADIKALVSPEIEYSAFTLVDAIAEGSAKKTLQQLELLTNRHSKLEEQAFPRIFPLLHRQFRLIWQARLCLNDRCPIDNPSPLVLENLPSDLNISKQAPWLQSRLQRSAQGLKLPQLARCIKELEAADSKLKGLEPAYTARETIEQMALKMAKICSGR